MGNPTLSKVIEDAIEARLSTVYTMIPGEVITVDVPAGKCSVRPLLKKKLGDQTVVDQPIISNVAIANYRAGEAFISLPVKVGDYVELRFSQRSLDIWLDIGGNIDPQDGRKFNISDCIAYPGMYPFNDPPSGATANDIVIKNEAATLIVKPDALELYGNGDAIALASKVMTELNKIKTAFDSHGHPYTWTGSGGAGTTSPPAAPVPALTNVASTKVKAE